MDKRKLNGGHSTKSKGVDKRTNPYRDVIKEVLTADKLKGVLDMLLLKAVSEKDIPAAKIVLEYGLGKPKETKDIKITTEQPLFDL